ncbi:MAG: hypothetical protein LBE78_06675 [Burkholderiaceae bacterium]|jgi:fatty acid desaturase|nr:hypothetical protein [Burkholderiaceae bacterium]
MSKETGFFREIFGEAFGGIAIHLVFWGAGAAGLWFLSQWWSAWVFFIAGAVLMIGLPFYFHLRSKRKNENT